MSLNAMVSGVVKVGQKSVPWCLMKVPSWGVDWVGSENCHEDVLHEEELVVGWRKQVAWTMALNWLRTT